MFKKKSLWLVAIFIAIQWCCIITPPAHSSDGSLKSRVLEYAGKTFTSTQDPSYHLYDLALREYMVDRIQKRFGVALDPKKYSGFDLLEIESCFKFKKSDEPLEMFLKMFPKHPQLKIKNELLDEANSNAIDKAKYIQPGRISGISVEMLESSAIRAIIDC